jgi:hypothetical protein
MTWPYPISFFTINESWINAHKAVPLFNYVEHAHLSPKIHQPDRLELELVSIRKQGNYVYEGQVLLNSQNFHGFGRILQYIGGPDSGNAYIYEGWFINGLPEGMGRKISEDGTIYYGKFRFGLENGEGTKTLKTDGEVENQIISQTGEFAFGIFCKETN